MSAEIGASNAIIYKIATTIDGGARLTLDLPEYSIDLISKLLQKKMQGKELVMCAFVEASSE